MPDDRSTRWFLDLMPPPEVLQEVLDGDPVARFVDIVRGRAIANGGLELNTRDSADPAVRAALTLATAAASRITKEGEAAQLTTEEKAALDLFVLLVARPALFVKDGRVPEQPENWPEIRRDRTLLPRTIAGVGRIDAASGAKTGTGFLVGDRRILTNNHVLCALFGLALGSWQTDPAGFAARCAAATKQWSKDEGAAPTFELYGEAATTTSERVRVVGVLSHHAQADMAVLELAATPPHGQWLSLALEEPASFVGRRVFAVGFPVDDARDWWGQRVTPLPVFQRVFGADDASLGTKRFSPGVILGWNGDSFLHDASTLPGSSGSCIVDFETRRVVGLHFAGSYAQQRNHAVPLWRYLKDPVLVGSGVLTT